MSSLENLVPTLELCKQIPNGNFENSAMVWRVDICPLGEVVRLLTRKDAVDYVGGRHFPAPTLEEILIAFKTNGLEFRLCDYELARMDWCHGFYTEMECSDIYCDIPIVESALRLWFKVKGIEVER